MSEEIRTFEEWTKNAGMRDANIITSIPELREKLKSATPEEAEEIAKEIIEKRKQESVRNVGKMDIHEAMRVCRAVMNECELCEINGADVDSDGLWNCSTCQHRKFMDGVAQILVDNGYTADFKAVNTDTHEADVVSRITNEEALYQGRQTKKG